MKTLINKHLQNRKKGFYFWTCKKNFLSVYILTKHLQIHKDEMDIHYLLLNTFELVIGRIRSEPIKIKTWEPKPMTESDLIQLCPIYMYRFLRRHRISIEEFLALSLDHINDFQSLLMFAIRCFSHSYETIDDYNSTASKIYMKTVHYPFYTLNAHQKIVDAFWGEN